MTNMKLESVTQKLVLQPSTESIAIISAGPQGPIGATGPAGTNGVGGTIGSGAPGAGTEGNWYWDSTGHRLWRYTAGAWYVSEEPWQSYTPTQTGITGGSPTLTGGYKRGDGTCDWWARLTFGATPSAIGTLVITFPPFSTNAVNADDIRVYGRKNADGSRRLMGGYAESPSSFRVTAWSAPTSVNTEVAVGLTVPFTAGWEVNDTITAYGRYTMNTR